MVKKSTILVQASLSFILGLAISFGLAWSIIFDLLKEKLNWSAQFSWPFFYLGWFLLTLLWTFYLIKKSHDRLVLAELVVQLTAIAHSKIDENQPFDVESEDTKQVVEIPKYGNQGKQLTALVHQVVEEFNRSHDEQIAIEKSKEEMMTNISHDLRTPLTAIIGYLGLVVTPNSPMKEEDRNKYLETAYHKSNQMRVLVEDLFEFAKLQSRHVDLNISDFSLGDLFDQVLANYVMEAENRGIRFATNLDPRLIVMSGDSDKLARVLINLVENALKYGENASFIKLTGKVKDNSHVEVRVINDGPAIPVESAKHIFDRFYRVEGSRNSKTGGTGLGLAIVKGIIEQHRGRVWVESDSELTSFVINLPLKQVKEEQHNGKESI